MSGELMMDILRAIRSDIASLSERFDDQTLRLGRVEAAVASLRREQSSDAEAYAEVQMRIDRIINRIGRIERRLDLVDTPPG
jgi:hypothetical protein